MLRSPSSPVFNGRLKKGNMRLNHQFIIIVVCGYTTVASSRISSSSRTTLQSGFNITAYANNLGYTIQVHQEIPTEDGYLLDIHRVPYGRFENKSNKVRPVAFLMHGLGANADSWMLSPKSLALFLADKGYDVWVGNARGTSHSKKHVTMRPSEQKFWDFSWHEIGYFDLPANLNYVLNYTNQEQLYYVGHSQGGTAFFVMTSQRPETNKMIKLMVGLAPGAFYGLGASLLPNVPASALARFLNLIKDALGLFFFDFKLFSGFCRLFGLFVPVPNLCQYSLLPVAGGNLLHIDNKLWPILLKVIPDSGAIKQLLHYLQLFVAAKFQQYDYGPSKNRQLYGSEHPPLYDLGKVTCPVGVFYGIADLQVTPFNSRKLVKALPNVVVDKLISEPMFTHIDLVLHKNIDTILYNELVEFMDNFEK